MPSHPQILSACTARSQQSCSSRKGLSSGVARPPTSSFKRFWVAYRKTCWTPGPTAASFNCSSSSSSATTSGGESPSRRSATGGWPRSAATGLACGAGAWAGAWTATAGLAICGLAVAEGGAWGVDAGATPGPASNAALFAAPCAAWETALAASFGGSFLASTLILATRRHCSRSLGCKRGPPPGLSTIC